MLRLRTIAAAAAAALLCSSAAHAQAAQVAATASGQRAAVSGALRDELLRQFDYSMQRLLALAEALPAERFAWGPTPEVMQAGHVYAHIANYNYRYPVLMGVAAPAGVGLDTLERMRDKAQLVALLRQSGQHARAGIAGMTPAQLEEETTLYGRRVPRWAVLVQLVSHMNEHLGQSISYARMAGIVPPWSS